MPSADFKASAEKRTLNRKGNRIASRMPNQTLGIPSQRNSLGDCYAAESKPLLLFHKLPTDHRRFAGIALSFALLAPNFTRLSRWHHTAEQ
jgi:hypothetical protein